MAGTFMARTNVLMKRVGTGKIEASVKVDQVYAQFQHQRPDLKRRRGGEPYFLRTALLTGHRHWYQRVANRMLNERMSTIFIGIADDFNTAMGDLTPHFLGDLGRSGQATVKESGRIVYRDGPAAKRLTKTQLRIKTGMWHHIYGDGRRH